MNAPEWARHLVTRAVAKGQYGHTVTDTEADAVTQVLTAALLTLGTLSVAETDAVDMGPQELSRRVVEALPPDTPNLSDEGTALLVALLDQFCLHVLHGLVNRWEAVPDGLRPQAERIARMVFEEQYRDHVAEAHNRMELFGLDIVRDPMALTLDTAYLAPMAEIGGDSGHGVRAEQALTGEARLLVRGSAGSGKTTLLSWLAVSAARRSLELSTGFGDPVPFLLPVRTIVRHGELPGPDEFLSCVGSPLADRAPDRWAHHLLAEGSGLVLLDGIDEVRPTERARVRRWLEELLSAYPHSSYVVTSRPSAVPEGWLHRAGFGELALLPLDRADIERFVSLWHTAAGVAQPTAHDQARLGEYENALLHSIRARRDLQGLMKNPLMCALICALHRVRVGHLPTQRVQLYDAALSMLLGRRDRERSIAAPEGVRLSEEDQRFLLGHIAYWMLRNGRVEAAGTELLAVLSDALRALPPFSADSREVYQHLLARSGLLRETAVTRVEFVHGPLMQYLAAQRIVEAGDLDLLVDNAHDDWWRECVILAVAYARPWEGRRVLLGLLERARRAVAHAEHVQLVLIAATAMEECAEADPEVRARVEEKAAELVPPQRPEDVHPLAQAGEMILRLFPHPAYVSESEAALMVRTAELIGGDVAQAFIRDFERQRAELARHTSTWNPQRPPAQHLFVASWTDDGASGEAGAAVRSAMEVRSDPDLARLAGAAHVHQLTCRGGITDYGPLRHLPGLRKLTIAGNPGLTGLDALSGCRKLRFLSVSDCPLLDDLSAVAGTDVTFLELAPLPSADRLGGLAGALWLRALHLPTATGAFDLEPLRRTLPRVEIVPGPAPWH
ncbi:ATP-binding protein [Wenjunlia tyrosinilytica]|uniref:ATP-binding protein n=1 Tax=Wenjunlia tyrosinilytica TaxID=1544741 RepID=A0A917ZJI3_9ACTN|nr:ATP-binding protein [Wenjunlia tyrosinilytica]